MNHNTKTDKAWSGISNVRNLNLHCYHVGHRDAIEHLVRPPCKLAFESVLIQILVERPSLSERNSLPFPVLLSTLEVVDSPISFDVQSLEMSPLFVLSLCLNLHLLCWFLTR